MSVELYLSKIPGKEELVKAGMERQVAKILEIMVNEFPEDNLMLHAQDNGCHWKWYVEIPFQVPEVLEHAVKDALSEKWFDQIHFNPYNSFKDGFTRMSLTVRKGASE